MTTIVWFRQDLRLADNPALALAAAAGPVIPVYLHAPDEDGAWAPGGASRWWLHESLQRLDEDLRALGSHLCLRVGRDSLAMLLELARQGGASGVTWNRRYEPQIIARDRAIKQALKDAGLAVTSHNASLLREPWEVASQTGGPMQVFTPFWRRSQAQGDPAEPLPPPRSLAAPSAWPATAALEDLELLPRIDWTRGMRDAWRPGRAGAIRQLEAFLQDSFADYSELRNRPDLGGTSRLSPYLHFGEIGPREVWQATRLHGLARGQADAWRRSQFVTELGWREFAYHLLYHFPQTPEQALRAKYAQFPWKSDAPALRAWQRGRTGYPIVDAGLRELWSTGWMHNRVRMITASFLVKDLLLPWNDGARWFWDTLVDADLASNTLGWQWAAGCGADAAPYFRIFNPILQGRKFDPDGDYVRRWVPELARLPSKWLHEPWNAPPATLQNAGVQLGTTYPRPIVDHDAARQEALAALATLKDARQEPS